MRIRTAPLLTATMLCAVNAYAQNACAAATAQSDAIPAFVGYTDVCVVDIPLCRMLSAGYPPSVRTLGYFVPDSAWRAYRVDSASRFTNYLIAQAAGRRSAEEFERLVQGLRQRNGVIPDNSRLPLGILRESRVPLGVVAETPNSITFGQIMYMQLFGARPEETVPMVALNIALQRKDATLSLYVFRRFDGEHDVVTAKQQAAAWVACIEAVH